MKTIDECKKAIAQAVTRAYGREFWPVDITTDFVGRDVRSFIAKTAGKPHTDLNIAKIAALALSRAEKMNGDVAFASTLADLIDGAVSIDREAAAARGLETLMAEHRRQRARSNPLPADLKAKAREDAPRVIRRGGGTAVRAPASTAPATTTGATSAIAPPSATPATSGAPRVPATPARPATSGAPRMPATPARPVRPATPAPPEVTRIASGARVRYRVLDDDTEHEVLLGGTAGEGTALNVRVVPTGSPLGRSLLGATKGTIVTTMLGGTSVELEILDVKKPLG